MKTYFLIIVSQKRSVLPLFFVILRSLSLKSSLESLKHTISVSSPYHLRIWSIAISMEMVWRWYGHGTEVVRI